MSFMIRKVSTSSTAVKLVESDPRRTHVDAYNESGEQVRYGDKGVKYAAGAGMPITNGQHLILYKSIGLDPTPERWVIGNIGGTITVIEEWV